MSTGGKRKVALTNRKGRLNFNSTCPELKVSIRDIVSLATSMMIVLTIVPTILAAFLTSHRRSFITPWDEMPIAVVSETVVANG